MNTAKYKSKNAKNPSSLSEMSSNDSFRSSINNAKNNILNCLSLAEEIRLAYILPSLKTQTRLKIETLEFESLIWNLCQENSKLILFINYILAEKIKSILKMIEDIESDEYEIYLQSIIALQVTQFNLLREFILKFITDLISKIDIQISLIDNDISNLVETKQRLTSVQQKFKHEIHELIDYKNDLFKKTVKDNFIGLNIHLPSSHINGNDTYIDYEKMSRYLDEAYNKNKIDSDFDSRIFVHDIAKREIYSANKHLDIESDGLERLIANTINHQTNTLDNLASSLSKQIELFSHETLNINVELSKLNEKIMLTDKMLNSINQVLGDKNKEKTLLTETKNTLSVQLKSFQNVTSIADLVNSIDLNETKFKDNFDIINTNNEMIAIDESALPSFSIEININLDEINAFISNEEQNSRLLPSFPVGNSEDNSQPNDHSRNKHNSELTKAGFFKPHTNPITDNPAKSPTTDPTKKTQP